MQFHRVAGLTQVCVAWRLLSSTAIAQRSTVLRPSAESCPEERPMRVVVVGEVTVMDPAEIILVGSVDGNSCLARVEYA